MKISSSIRLSFRVPWCFFLVVFVSSVFQLPLGYSSARRQEDSVLETRQHPEMQARKIKGMARIPKEIDLVAIRNYKSEHWYRDLEFEVQNNSDKPIIYILLFVEMPEYKNSGATPAFRLEYGDRMLTSKVELRSQAPGLGPQERYVLKIPAYQAENFKKRYSPDGISFPRVSELNFRLYYVLYSDGTGFAAGEPALFDPDGVKPTN